jgi:hypothetical protein
MTDWYLKQVPESVREAVVKMDGDICKAKPGRPNRQIHSVIVLKGSFAVIV